MTESLGKASLDLEANLAEFERNMAAGKQTAHGMGSSLRAVAAIAEIAEKALNDVKMSPGQAAESRSSAEGILSGVRGISDDARVAARELDRVRLTEAQGAESKLAADEISSGLNQVSRNADQAKRKLAEVRLAGGRNGAGVGPFGSGFGRIGLLGAGIGAGVLTGPAAAPGAAGLLAAIPTLGAGALGGIGTLVLALQGVSKAIGGDKKAFDELQPSAKQFVLTVRSLSGWLDKLKETAGKGLFPGLTKGLRSALSPELIGTLTTAVAQLGHALGMAAAQWGRYFGSPQFTALLGPLMAAGAHNIGTLSDAMLHLFDALAVIGRAAIPFTSWLTTAIDNGAKLADTWLRAKDATGGLGHALGEAEKSLRLVWNLFTALGNAVGSLGAALYPVAKVAVKDLTNGLNALAGIIDRNKQTIREVVGGALAALVSTVKALTPLVEHLAHWLNVVAHAIGGWKTAFEIVISGFLVSKFLALGGAIGGVWTKLGGIGPRLGRIGLASEAAKGEVGTLRAALLGLGAPEVLAAIAAAAGAFALYKAFTSPRPKYVAPSPSDATTAGNVDIVRSKGRFYVQAGPHLTPYTGTLPDGSVVKAGVLVSGAGRGYTPSSRGEMRGAYAPPEPAFKEPGTAMPYLDYQLSKAASTPSLADDRSVLQRMISTLRARLSQAHSLSAKTALQDAINSYTEQLKAAQATPFGADPPFPTKDGKPAVIPPLASHDLALASANAGRASALGNAGKAARAYLDSELSELNAAAGLIKAKYESATGKARTQLFAALTSVQNKIRSVRTQLGKSLTSDQSERLKLAVETAKLAVANATVGSAAYTKAIAAEEKALRAEIAYFDKRVKNAHLALKARTAAARAELVDKKALAKLLKASAGPTDASKNEAQFLSSFTDIEKSFAPNAFPKDATGGGGKADTRLHELVTESRKTNDHLRSIRTSTMFPATAYERGVAVAG